MSTRNIHVNTASYTLLVAGKKKNTGEEWDVLEFSSLTELKKYRKSHPEKMAFSYSYALSQGVDKQFGVVCGRGRNPTLRLWPTIFSGKIDVFPGDRRSRLISSMTSVAPA